MGFEASDEARTDALHEWLVDLLENSNEVCCAPGYQLHLLMNIDHLFPPGIYAALSLLRNCLCAYLLVDELGRNARRK